MKEKRAFNLNLVSKVQPNEREKRALNLNLVWLRFVTTHALRGGSEADAVRPPRQRVAAAQRRRH